MVERNFHLTMMHWSMVRPSAMCRSMVFCHRKISWMPFAVDCAYSYEFAAINYPSFAASTRIVHCRSIQFVQFGCQHSLFGSHSVVCSLQLLILHLQWLKLLKLRLHFGELPLKFLPLLARRLDRLIVGAQFVWIHTRIHNSQNFSLEIKFDWLASTTISITKSISVVEVTYNNNCV